MNSQGLILAAGRGSRMREETANKPKCLIKLAGKELLNWQLDALREGGVDTITVAKGYLAEMLQGEYNTVENPDWATTNMVSTFLCALPSLNETSCIVSYSDIVYHPKHIEALRKTNGDITITYDIEWEKLWKLRFENPLEDAETFVEKNGFLQNIGDKTNSINEIKGQFMGLLHFTQTGLKIVNNFLTNLPKNEVSNMDMTTLLQKLLETKISVTTIPVSGCWCEADSMSDIQAYEQSLKDSEENNKIWSHDWRNKEDT